MKTLALRCHGGGIPAPFWGRERARLSPRRVDSRSDLVLDDDGAPIALHSITFEAVSGGHVTVGFGNETTSQLIMVLQKLLAGTIEKQFEWD